MASRTKGSTVWDVSRERGCEGGRETVFSQLPPHCCGRCHFLNREIPKPPRAPCPALTLLFLQHCPSLSCQLISTLNQKGPSSTPVFITALFTIVKTWKQPKCPSTDEWIKKMWHIYTMEYYSAIKQDEMMPLSATWMDLEMIILKEVCQTEKDKYHMILLICGI